MIPVANFLVTPNLLSVAFTDISTGTPTSWSWDFGDSTALGTTQNPSHTYSVAGQYTVKLTATNGDGVSILQRVIMVASTPVLPVTVKTFVNIKLPAGLTVSEETKDAFISEAQLFIQPLVDPEVVYADVFNEIKYPPLANALVAYLATYSILASIVAGNAAVGSSTAGGGIKKITTGPSEVEYQDMNDTIKAFFGKDGVGTVIATEACSLAARLDIWLPFCPKLPKPIIVPLKAVRTSLIIPESAWLQYPYLIPITI